MKCINMLHLQMRRYVGVLAVTLSLQMCIMLSKIRLVEDPIDHLKNEPKGNSKRSRIIIL